MIIDPEEHQEYHFRHLKNRYRDDIICRIYSS